MVFELLWIMCNGIHLGTVLNAPAQPRAACGFAHFIYFEVCLYISRFAYMFRGLPGVICVALNLRVLRSTSNGRTRSVCEMSGFRHF